MNYTISKNQYGSYAIPTNTISKAICSRIVNGGGVYEPDTIDYILKNCGDGGIIHAGTFFGDFLPALGSTGNYVLCFEPVLENYECARKTIELNYGEDHNIHIFNYGLGAKHDAKYIKTKDAMGVMAGRSRYMPAEDDKPGDGMELTSIVAIDDIVKQEQLRFDEFSILHLDVEGFESHALLGAIEVIRQSKPILLIEAWGDATFNDAVFKTEIFPLGYNITTRLPSDIVILQCS